MTVKLASVFVCAIVACSAVMAGQESSWWNGRWRLRTTVTRPSPYRDDVPRPVEVAMDFPLLLERAGIPGQLDPASLRVIDLAEGRQVPFARRTEFNAREGREQDYLSWMARPGAGEAGEYDIYFDTQDRGIEAHDYDADLLPPENLVQNAGFEQEADGLPAGWTVEPSQLVRPGRFEHTTGQRSLSVVVDENTPAEADRDITIAQMVDVRRFAGQEMVFECDLLAERAPYGAPISIRLQQFRADGSQIPECAVEPRWLTLELAEGQLVQFCERGRFSHEAATAKVAILVRRWARDADTGENVAGPEGFFTVWLDRVVVRPGERWPWPAATNAGFVEGALENAPVNRGFEFTGQRRLAFNGASEATLTAHDSTHDPKSVHWGLEAGTLEFWCKPSWNADDGRERIFFTGFGYLYRLQSRLRKLSADGDSDLEFTISDADRELHTVRGPAPLRAGQWHHLAATWDLPRAHLQLFVDGKLLAAQGPGADPWPSSLSYKATAGNQVKGNGTSDEDSRSLPMQAFMGGRVDAKKWPDGYAAEAVLDEFRISDVVRYAGDFAPSREECAVDEATRALFHFENQGHGDDSNDRLVRAYLGCELPPQEQEAVVEVLSGGRIERRAAVVRPHASNELFEANRGENRLTVTHPFRELPDPRFIEYRHRQIERTVSGPGEGFTLQVGGDFEPLMRSVTFERVEGASAETTLLPRWRANDNVVPFSVQSIAATLAPDASSDAEKALEAFRYALQVANYYDAHYCETLPGGRHRPRISYTMLKALNIYPYDQCGPLNHTLRKLFLAAGISSNNAPGTHHQFQQAFFDGSWRLYDLSSRMYWLNRDNETVIGLRGVGEDPYCKLRQGTTLNSYYPARPSGPSWGLAERPHSMDFPLRLGESASVCWHNEGRWFEVTGDHRPIPLAKIPPWFGNGAIVWRLRDPAGRQAVAEPTDEGEAPALDNLLIERAADGRVAIRAQDPARPASLIYRLRCPYILSGGLVTGAYDARQAGAVALSLSFDEGESWTEVWRSPDKAGEIAASLLEQVTGRYAYWLKVELAEGQEATLSDLKVRSVFVDAPRSLPGKLSLGENRISFVGGPVTAAVRTTCSWVERHRSDLGVSLNAISYYTRGPEEHRNLFIIAPGEQAAVRVSLEGRALRGEVSLEGLPEGWLRHSRPRKVQVTDAGQPASADFSLKAEGAVEGEIHGFDVVLREGDAERRVACQVLVAEAALAREAERADELSGQAVPVEIGEVSGGRGVAFEGEGGLAFDFAAPREGMHALWLRARWELGSSTQMKLALGEGETRELRPYGMIGFTDWTEPSRAHTKTFLLYGKEYQHWGWYRVPDLELAEGKHRLTLSADSGACLDAVILLPQSPTLDRATMNLFQNWTYAPWDSPL